MSTYKKEKNITHNYKHFPEFEIMNFFFLIVDFYDSHVVYFYNIDKIKFL